MLNRIVLIGRLTKDPELRYTPSGVAVAQFTLAVDRNFKTKDGQRETDFITIVVYRQQAENCANYLSKGKLAAVDGRLQIRTYDDNSGQRRWVTEVVADNVRFLSPKDGGSPAAAPRNAAPGDDFGAFVEVSVEDDIPF
ncbi:MAG: single-stranded DNA-binding protein [Gracilibacteraceae bacterium]|jgi:single-strand DNA-binding protein|nr:single-stranded DNA-binding protein [Gracilibacteraceae bacterium]